MVKISQVLLVIIYGIVICSQVQTTTSNYRTAEVLEYKQIFSETSDLSVIVFACGSYHKLSLTLKSFFYFNTYKIYKVYIALCLTSRRSIQNALPYGYNAHQGKFQIIYAQNDDSSLTDALQNVYKKITTKYVYQTDGNWVMTKGFGFIHQAIKVINYENIKQSRLRQIVSNYPYWRSTARLSQLIWSSTGETYHKIFPFAPQNYAYFTLSPSVFQFGPIYKQFGNKKIKQLCKQICQHLNFDIKQSIEQDKCCIWALGQHISTKGYQQIYLTDGTGEPNHEFIQ